MISFMKGSIQEILSASVILEVNNIGYELLVSDNTLQNISCNKETLLHTYLNVREDELTLFGFLTKDELQMFKLLIKVNGVGPKAALSILSTLNTADLRYAILAGDSTKISNAKGIGKKTSERILIDLKDKVSRDDLLDANGTICYNSTNQSDEMHKRYQEEVVEALINLGYTNKIAKSAVDEVPYTKEMNVEQFLKEALKRMR